MHTTMRILTVETLRKTVETLHCSVSTTRTSIFMLHFYHLFIPDLNSKFKGKYRIQSSRLKGWDYATPAYYFITICTQNRIPWLGEIINDRVILSQSGKIASDNLERIHTIYTNISLDAWIVMPN